MIANAVRRASRTSAMRWTPVPAETRDQRPCQVHPQPPTLVFMRLLVTVLVGVTALVMASCGGSDGEVVSPQPTVTPVGAPTAAPTTAPPPTATTSTDPTATPPPGVAVISVEQLFDGEGPRPATLRGSLYVETGGTRLCDLLRGSSPPECGWAWVVIANPEELDIDLDEAQGIAWSPTPVELVGIYDGGRFILDDGPDVAPTAADQALVEAVATFAASGAGFDAIPFADRVAIGLADEIVRTVPSTELADPTVWAIERDEFRGWVGPFSALELAVRESMITIGPHAHCASPPVVAPTGFERHRRVSVQPVGATSCLEWSTVDYFVDDDGRIAAVTVDLFAP